MTDFPDGIVIEARKAGLKQAKRKAADGSWFDVHDITFEIHPNDTNSPLSNMPLGTRVALVVTQLREEDAAEPPQTQTAPETVDRPKGGERARRAGILCNKPTFQIYIQQIGPPQRSFPPDPPSHQMTKDAERARDILLRKCFVKSMRDLDHDLPAGGSFDEIVRQFERVQYGETDPEVTRQLAEGPR